MKPVVRSPPAESLRFQSSLWNQGDGLASILFSWGSASLGRGLPVSSPAGYLPQADAGCSESVLTMALSQWLTRWVGVRGAGECVEAGLVLVVASTLTAGCSSNYDVTEGWNHFQGQDYEQVFPLLVLTNLVKLKVGTQRECQQRNLPRFGI